MKKPKYISEENWNIIIRPENKFTRLSLGCGIKGEESGEWIFDRTFRTKKAALEYRDGNKTKLVTPYLNGFYRVGWTIFIKKEVA